MASKDFISLLDVEKNLGAILDETRGMKNRLRSGEPHELLRSKSLGMIFEKPSTRTRVSFEVGMAQLGGTAIYLNPADLQLGRGETLEDTARVISRYVDGVVYRAIRHENMVRLARAAAVPVINGLDDLEHPCQVIADLYTIQEATDGLEGLRLAYVGDGNNVCNSLLLGCALSGISMTAGCPPGYEPNAEILRQAKKIAAGIGSDVELQADPKKAVEDADVVYTDVWVSMGMEEEKGQRERDFAAYQVNSELLEASGKDPLIMHCLPAHRGMEITDEVMDGKRSLVWEQAENRLHAQKAILLWLLGGAF